MSDETVTVNNQPVTVSIEEQPVTITLGGGGGGGSGCCPTSSVTPANSSIVPLGAGGIFTGTGDDVSSWAAIECAVITDQNGILQLEFSPDKINWDIISSYNIVAGTPFTIQLVPSERYFRVVYANGPTLQTIFRLQSVYKLAAGIPVGLPGEPGINAAYVQGITGGLPINITGTVSVAGTGATTTVIQAPGSSITTIPSGTTTVTGTVSTTGTLSGGVISAGNSTNIPLPAGGTFLGTGEDVSSYASIELISFSDQNAQVIPEGLLIQFSTDNVHWDYTLNSGYAPAANTTFLLQSPVIAKYFRVSYTNGGTAQTQFRLQVSYKLAAGVPIGEPSENSTHAVFVQGIGSGYPIAIAPQPNTTQTVVQSAASQITVRNFPATQTVFQSAPVTIIPSGTTTITGTVATTGLQGVISPNNSTTATLLANGTFTGVGDDVSGYVSVEVMAIANVDSAANGLLMQFSSDNVNWDSTTIGGPTFGYSTFGGQVFLMQLPVYARYFRVVYTNGSIAQNSYFRLQTSYKLASGIPVGGTLTTPNVGVYVQGVKSGWPVSVIPTGITTVTPAANTTVTTTPAPGSSVTIIPSGTQTVTGTVVTSGALAGGVISTNNSTSVTLGASATFTGLGDDVTNYASVEVLAFSDKASNPNGLQLQFSTNNTNWDYAGSPGYSVTANTPFNIQIPVMARYFRVVYANGGLAQVAFRLQTSYKLATGIPVGGSATASPIGAYVQGVSGGQPIVTTPGVGATQTVTGFGINSNNNSTANALAANGVYTGNFEDVTNYASIEVESLADQNAAAGGLQIQFSPNGANADYIQSYSPVANTAFAIQVPVMSRFFRIVYTNGTTLQGTFRLSTSYKTSTGIPVGGTATNSPVAAYVQGVTGGIPIPTLPSGTQTVIPAPASSVTIVPSGTQTITGTVVTGGGLSGGIISTNNSTTVTLAANGVFTGTGDDVSGYANVEVTLFSPQASASNGLQMQFSVDNVNWDSIVNGIYFGTGSSYPGGVSFVMQSPVIARYFRIVYTNGGTIQASFRLQTSYKLAAGIPVGTTGSVANIGVYVQGMGASATPLAVTPNSNAVFAVQGPPSAGQNPFPITWKTTPSGQLTVWNTNYSKTAAANTAITITVNPAGFYTVIQGIVWSYSGGTPTGSILIQESGVTMFQIDITANGPGFIPFDPPIRTTSSSGTITAVLGAGGTGLIGKLNLLGGWLVA